MRAQADPQVTNLEFQIVPYSSTSKIDASSLRLKEMDGDSSIPSTALDRNRYRFESIPLNTPIELIHEPSVLYVPLDEQGSFRFKEWTAYVDGGNPVLIYQTAEAPRSPIRLMAIPLTPIVWDAGNELAVDGHISCHLDVNANTNLPRLLDHLPSVRRSFFISNRDSADDSATYYAMPGDYECRLIPGRDHAAYSPDGSFSWLTTTVTVPAQDDLFVASVEFPSFGSIEGVLPNFLLDQYSVHVFRADEVVEIAERGFDPRGGRRYPDIYAKGNVNGDRFRVSPIEEGAYRVALTPPSAAGLSNTTQGINRIWGEPFEVVSGQVTQAPITVDLGEVAEFRATLVDFQGRQIRNRPVLLQHDGWVFAGHTDENGVASVPYRARGGSEARLTVRPEGVLLAHLGLTQDVDLARDEGAIIYYTGLTRYAFQVLDAQGNPVPRYTIRFSPVIDEDYGGGHEVESFVENDEGRGSIEVMPRMKMNVTVLVTGQRQPAKVFELDVDDDEDLVIRIE